MPPCLKVFKSTITVFLSACVFILSTASTPAQGPERTSLLADDGARVSSFAQFRKQLQAAAALRDRRFVESHLSEHIGMALGGGIGPEDFLKQWQNLSPQSKFWSRLSRILSHGATYDSDQKEFNAPAVQFDDDHGAFMQAIVWNKNAKLRRAPSLTAAVLRTIYNQKVTIIDSRQAGPLSTPWAKVKTGDGSSGFIQASDLYCDYDEFAKFKNEQGQWKMIWFGFAGT